MSIDYISIGSSFGIGSLTGFLIGFAIKKIVEIVLVVIGLFFAALAYLQYQGIITVDWNRLETSTIELATGIRDATSFIPGGFSDQMTSLVTNFNIPLAGGLTGGFVIGFMKG